MPFYYPLWAIQPPAGNFVGASNQMLYAWSALYGDSDPAPAMYNAEIYVGGVLVTTIKGIQAQGQGEVFPGVQYKQFGIDIGRSIVARNIKTPDYDRWLDGSKSYANIWDDCLKDVFIVLIAHVEDPGGFIIPLPDLDITSDTVHAIKGSVGPYDRSAPDSAFWIQEIGGSFATGYAIPLSNKPYLSNTSYNSVEQMSFIRNQSSPEFIGIIYTQDDGTVGGAMVDVPYDGAYPDYLQISVGPDQIFSNGTLHSGSYPTSPIVSYQFFLMDGGSIMSPVFQRTVLKGATVEAVFMNEFGAWDTFVFTSGLNQSDVNTSEELYKIPVTGIYASDNVMQMQRGRDLANVRSDQKYMVECDLRAFESAWLTELQRTPKLYLNNLSVSGGVWGGAGSLSPVTRDNAEQVRRQNNKDVTRFRLSGTYAMTLPTIQL